MLPKRIVLGVSVALTALITACGGGGGGSSNAGGTSSGLMSNRVTIDSASLTGGQSVGIHAAAAMRGSTPKSMLWTIASLSGGTAPGPVPSLNDMKCATASYSVPAVSGASGEGACNTILTIPTSAKSGTWRITNTASSDAGSVSNFVDIQVNALTSSGFRLLDSSTPLTAYVGKLASLSLPFTANDSAVVSNVKYVWAASTANPAVVAVSGSQNSTASFTPTVAGQYTFYVSVSADVNGNAETATSTVVVVVYPATTVDVIDAGAPQIATPGQKVTLNGAIANQDKTLTYVTSWTQLAGSAGGPTTVNLTNTNSATPSFLAPSALGTYGFEFKVVKSLPDGTQSLTTAQTSVVVQPTASALFTVSAGDMQSVPVGSISLLKGSIGAQSNTTDIVYSYQWTQVSGPSVTLSNANAATASFMPTTTGTYTFSLAVKATNTSGGAVTVSGTTQVVATASATGSTAFALSADAGTAQSVAPNAVTTLRGAQTTQGSTTGVGYAYAWTQVGVAPAVVTLSNPSTATATFFPTVAGVYSFQLTVTATLPDATTRTATSNTQVVVGGAGNTFSVSAGNAQSILLNTPAAMSGVVTTQGTYSGATFSYAWTQVGATPAVATISNTNALTASFIPTVAGTYSFLLTVTADQGGVITTQTSQTQVLAHP